MTKQSDDQFTDEEVARRSEAALLRALNTPRKKQSEMKIGKQTGRRTAKANPTPTASGA
jgi:hypothetical protein